MKPPRYVTGGVEIAVVDIIDLRETELAEFRASGVTRFARPIEWPVPNVTPDFRAAYIDRGGTPIWGPGPYLKVPNVTSDGDALVNRVFCPWGYPPERLRIRGLEGSATISIVELECDAPGSWNWVVTLTAAAGSATPLQHNSSPSKTP